MRKVFVEGVSDTDNKDVPRALITQLDNPAVQPVTIPQTRHELIDRLWIIRDSYPDVTSSLTCFDIPYKLMDTPARFDESMDAMLQLILEYKAVMSNLKVLAEAGRERRSIAGRKAWQTRLRKKKLKLNKQLPRKDI